MRKLLFIMFLTTTVLSIFGQQWNGSSDNNGAIYRSGNVGIGVTSVSYPLVVAHPNFSISTSDTNYKITSDIGIYTTYSIPSGIKDDGYRMGLNINAHIRDANFLGTLVGQYGIRIQHGTYNGSGVGTLENSFGLYLQGLESGDATIINKYGIYQTGSNFKNYFAGNIGIGTTTPLQKFNVHGNSGSPSISGTIQNGIAAFSNVDNYSTLYIGNYPTSPLGMWIQASARHNLSINYPIILNPNGGKVGIGVVSPEETLHVNGTMTITGNIGTVNDGNHWQTGKHTLELQNNDAGDVVLAFHRAGYTIASIRQSSSGGLIFSGSGVYNSNHMHIKSNGNIGIGTDLSSNPNNYKLAVNGTIGAKEVLVEITSETWSDFVFSSNYKLKSIREVENYINEKNHLPDIPTAKEVEENGVNLGEMDAKLLQKIEELTLYMIQMNKEIETLKEENRLLKEQMNL